MVRRVRGFSLIELMISMAIVGVLAAIAIPSLGALVAKSRQAEAKAGLSSIHTLEMAYFAEANSFGSLTEIGFVSEGAGRYGFLISPTSFVPPGIEATTGGGDKNPLSEVGDDSSFYLSDDSDDDDDDIDDGGPTYGAGNPHYDAVSFEVVAVGVISAAPLPNDLDIWSIDNFHTLENINPGF